MEKDLTKGREWKVIAGFAVPLMCSYLLQFLYNLSDSIIVGNFVGPGSFGAIGITSSMTWLMVNVCAGIGTGTSIIVAQYYGAGNAAGVKGAIGGAMCVCGIGAVIMTIVCLFLAKPLIKDFMNAPVHLCMESVGYFQIYSMGIVFQILYNVIYGVLRACGDSKSSILFLLISSIINIVLDLIFVILFQQGVEGAAWATVISQAIAAIACGGYLKYFFPSLWPNRDFFIEWSRNAALVLQKSVPIIMQSAATALGLIVLQRLVNAFGQASIEAYAAIVKIEQIAYIPRNALNVTMGSFVGQNIGAQRMERVENGLRAAVKIGLGSTAILAVLVMIFAEIILGWFNISGDALLRGKEHLYILMIFSSLTCLTNVLGGFLQGAGDVKPPAVAEFTNLSVRVILAYLMALTKIGFRSIYMSIPFAWCTACALNLYRYRSGAWKSHQVT
jgi:putative MATE family efflux protein